MATEPSTVPALAALVFGHPDALADLNAITHPAIGIEMIARRDRYADTDDIVVLDIPLLRAIHRETLDLAAVIVVDTPTDAGLRAAGEPPGHAARRRPGPHRLPTRPPDPPGRRRPGGRQLRATGTTSRPKWTGSGPSCSPCVAATGGPPRRPPAPTEPIGSGWIWSRARPVPSNTCPNSRWSRRSALPATSPRPSPDWSRASSGVTATRPFWASPGRARPPPSPGRSRPYSGPR